MTSQLRVHVKGERSSACSVTIQAQVCTCNHWKHCNMWVELSALHLAVWCVRLVPGACKCVFLAATRARHVRCSGSVRRRMHEPAWRWLAALVAPPRSAKSNPVWIFLVRYQALHHRHTLIRHLCTRSVVNTHTHTRTHIHIRTRTRTHTLILLWPFPPRSDVVCVCA